MATKDVAVRLIAITSQYQAAMANATKSTAALSSTAAAGTKTASAGFAGLRAVAKPAGLVLAGTAVAAGKMASGFETSFAKIQGLVGVSADQIGMMREAVMNLSGETAKSPQELADALFFITSAGLEGAEAIDALEFAAKASTAGLGDTAVVADALTSAMNAYAEEGLTAAEATDVLVAAVREGKLEPDQLAGSLGKVIPIAAEMGVEFDEVAAAIARMSRGGLGAEEGTTALRGMLTGLLSPSKETEQALSDMGLSLEDVQDSLANQGLLSTLQMLQTEVEATGGDMSDIFPNVRALAGAMQILGGDAEATAEQFDAVKNSTGDTDKAFNTMAETSTFKLSQAFNDLKADIIAVGDPLLDLTAGAVGLITGLSDLGHEIMNMDLTDDQDWNPWIEQAEEATVATGNFGRGLNELNTATGVGSSNAEQFARELAGEAMSLEEAEAAARGTTDAFVGASAETNRFAAMQDMNKRATEEAADEADRAREIWVRSMQAQGRKTDEAREAIEEQREAIRDWLTDVRSSFSSGELAVSDFTDAAATDLDALHEEYAANTQRTNDWKDDLVAIFHTIADRESPEMALAFIQHLDDMGIGYEDVVDQMANDTGKAVESFDRWAPAAEAANRNVVDELEGLSDLAAAEVEEMADAPDWAGIGSTMSNSAAGVGSDIMFGMAGGVDANAWRVASSVSNAAASAVLAGEKAMLISSPSKVTADRIGAPMAQGIAMGIQSEAHTITDALEMALEDATSEAEMTSEAASAASDLARSTAGTLSDTLRGIGQERGIEDATLRIEDAQLRLEEAQAAFTEDQSDENRRAVEDARRALQDANTTLFKDLLAQAERTGELNVEMLKKSGEAAGLTVDQVNKVIGEAQDAIDAAAAAEIAAAEAEEAAAREEMIAAKLRERNAKQEAADERQKGLERKRDAKIEAIENQRSLQEARRRFHEANAAIGEAHVERGQAETPEEVAAATKAIADAERGARDAALALFLEVLDDHAAAGNFPQVKALGLAAGLHLPTIRALYEAERDVQGFAHGGLAPAGSLIGEGPEFVKGIGLVTTPHMTTAPMQVTGVGASERLIRDFIAAANGAGGGGPMIGQLIAQGFGANEVAAAVDEKMRDAMFMAGRVA